MRKKHDAAVWNTLPGRRFDFRAPRLRPHFRGDSESFIGPAILGMNAMPANSGD
jgi:hypothetical protein